MIYNRLKELFEKGLELTNEIIELKKSDFYHRCELNAIIDEDIWNIEFHNKKLTEINTKLSGLEKQLEEVKTQIKAL